METKHSSVINIYCDESCHLEHDNIKPMLLGAIWCPYILKNMVFREIREIKKKHGLSPRCELKWNAVSPSKIAYYQDVLRYFFENPDLHFRVLIVPDKSILRHEDFAQTHDQFYYKMYFDLLKVIISPQHAYNIYLDIKDTHGAKKIEKLHHALSSNQYDFNHQIVQSIQQVNSHDVELVELADFLTGAVSYAYRELSTSEAKVSLVKAIKQYTGYSLKKSTLYREDKFNIFIWKGRVNYAN